MEFDTEWIYDSQQKTLRICNMKACPDVGANFDERLKCI